MNGGDQLARGAISATFPACESRVKEDKWKAAFDDYDPATFLANAEAEEQAARERKAQRLLEEQVESEQREAAQQISVSPEASKDDEMELRFGSRYSDLQKTGVFGAGAGEAVKNSGE